ncbi:MAG TPA: hypothetical protein GX740_02475 [Acholeplasmataceae bacterium]|nr:hypothetical protein [Acholeplasmataceae bacterium]
MAKKIYGNSELNELRVKIEKFLNKFATELETINNEHNPDFVRLEKRKNNILYYLGLTGFLFIIITMTVLLGTLEAFYLILIVYGINLLLTGYGFILFRKVNKQYNLVKASWDKAYKEVLTYQEEANKLYKLAEKEVYKVMAKTLYHEELEKLSENNDKYNEFLNEKILEAEEKVKEELGRNYSSEAVVSYYEEWGNSITMDGPSYDYLEARRRKAMLSSKNIDIDSKGEND